MRTNLATKNSFQYFLTAEVSLIINCQFFLQHVINQCTNKQINSKASDSIHSIFTISKFTFFTYASKL